ncbi:MAG: SDR family NAD(P)-dependent oxidoreductase [Isosphaeraceae bacterium]
MTRPDAEREDCPTALITGASSGLGAEVARAIVRAGKCRSLALTARREDRLRSLADELRSIDAGVEVLTIACDLTEPEAASRVVEETVARFGGLGLLINNAGLGLPTLFADAEPEHLGRQIALNFTAPLLLTRQALPHLARERGMIINIGSAITTIANSALGAYGATKAGLAYWNDALRRELHSKGVRVCLVEPGPIRTEFSQAFARLGREGTRPHPVVEAPSAWMTADVADVALRIAGLIDRPKRRLSVLRRLVWPMRALGALFQLWPALGDLLVTRGYRVDHSRGGPAAEDAVSPEVHPDHPADSGRPRPGPDDGGFV